MKKISIDSNSRRLNVSSIVVGYLEENKTEKIEFIIPDKYKEFGKKACFNANGKIFAKIFDDINGSTLTFTRDITKYKELEMSIEFFKIENEDEIIARTSNLHIIIENAVICDDDISPDDPKIIILDKLIEEVTKVGLEVEKKGDYAKEQGDYAKSQGDYAKEQKIEVVKANEEANRIINNFETNVGEYTTSFNENANNKTTDFDSNAESKTSDFNTNATTKTSVYDNNADEKLTAYNKNDTEKLNAYNSNASSKILDFNTNSTAKSTAYNNNASEKLNSFNSNSSLKVEAFNSNAADRTTAFNNNYDDKVNAFNSNANNQTEEFDSHVLMQTTAFNNNANSKVEEYNQNATELISKSEFAYIIADDVKLTRSETLKVKKVHEFTLDDFILYKENYYIEGNGTEKAYNHINIYEFNVTKLSDYEYDAIRYEQKVSWGVAGTAKKDNKFNYSLAYLAINSTSCIEKNWFENQFDTMYINAKSDGSTGINKIILYKIIGSNTVDEDINLFTQEIYRSGAYTSNHNFFTGKYSIVKVPVDFDNYEYHVKTNCNFKGDYYDINDNYLAPISVESSDINGYKKIKPYYDNVSYLLINRDLYTGATAGGKEYMFRRPKKAEKKYFYKTVVDKPYNLEGASTTFYGDSITAGGSSSPQEKGYVLYFQEKHHTTLQLAAVSGSKFTKTGTNQTITEKIQSVEATGDFIFIAGGVNDAISKSAIGSLNDTELDTFYGSLNILSSHLKTTYPNKVITFILPINAPSLQPEQLKPYRQCIYNVAVKNGFNVVNGEDFGFPESKYDDMYKVLIADGVHPNKYGHKLYAMGLSNAMC